MKFYAAVSHVFMTGAALANATTNTARPRTLDVVALRTVEAILGSSLAAANRGLLLDLANQNATCKGENARATVYLEDNKLFLYSGDDKPQLVFVDRSGMGQGVTGYVDAGGSLPRYGEVAGWSIDGNGNLTFAGSGLQACPGAIDGAWRVWAAGVQRPGGSEGCVGFAAHVLPNDDPVGCRYS